MLFTLQGNLYFKIGEQTASQEPCARGCIADIRLLQIDSLKFIQYQIPFHCICLHFAGVYTLSLYNVFIIAYFIHKLPVWTKNSIFLFAIHNIHIISSLKFKYPQVIRKVDSFVYYAT